MSWISLTEAKKELNKSIVGTTDDDELGGFVDAACSMIEEIKGHVEPVDAVQVLVASRIGASVSHCGWRRFSYVLDLAETPVLFVESVALLDLVGGSTALVEAVPDTGVLGWTLTGDVLTVPQPGTYEITYLAGRDPVPANYRMAALELVAHLWRGSQLNQGAKPGRPGLGGSDMQTSSPRGGMLVSAMPYRVRELLGIYGDVVNDHVVIA